MKEEIKQALDDYDKRGRSGDIRTLNNNAPTWLRWQNERIEELEDQLNGERISNTYLHDQLKIKEQQVSEYLEENVKLKSRSIDQHQRIKELEKALERAKEEMCWGDSPSAIERASAIINLALGKEQSK